MGIKTAFSEKRAVVEEALNAYMLKAEGPLADHITAMRYSLFADGKRVRPILCLAAAEALGADSKPLLPVACALECIHTYSLIHDDLPAMDNDDLRRGMPTNHKKFGEAAAILAGDGLLSYAFELLTLPVMAGTLAPADQLRITHIIAKAIGPLGMVGGQALDIDAEGKNIAFDDLRQIHRCKTGALITAAIQAGAVGGRADQRQFTALSAYGEHLGLAFQIVDDLLNVEGTTEQLGKAAGSDAERHKATYPAFFGVEKTRQLAKNAVDTALESLKEFDGSADFLRELALYIFTRKK